MSRPFEERFRLITETISEVFWMAMADQSRCLYVSPGYERIWGRTCQSACDGSMSFMDAIHPDDRERVVQAIRQRSGEAFEHEYRIVHSDGTTRWIWDRGYPVRDAAGVLEHYVGVAQDITARRRAELEHAKLAERFELAARATNDGFWDWDIVTGTAWWSETYYDLFGLERTVVPSYERWAEQIHPDDRARVVEGFGAALERGDASWSDEYRFVRPDGEVRESFDRAYVIYNHAGRPIRMGGALMDITARRALETQLRHAQKMEAMGQLAGGIAHDFNNLLQAIMLDLQLIKGVPEVPAKAIELAQHVHAATQRAASLTRQLLVFSRRETMQPHRHELDLAIADLARMLDRVLGEDVELEVQLGAANVSILVDRGMLDQVLLNLVVNARDAMPQGGLLTITTSAVTHRSRPGRHACIAVRDSGIGIPRDIVARIFDPFFTTKEPGQGTGLGLAMVFGIVEQHRGWIEVDSEPGAGATFRIYLPIDDGVIAVREIAAERELRGSETILVVEDDDHVRRGVRQVLEQQGYRVFEANNGRSALLAWEREAGRIQLVVTDLVMPGGMDGRQLADELERRRPGLKIVFATGHRRDVALRQRHTLLYKPVSAEDLVGAVRASLDT